MTMELLDRYLKAVKAYLPGKQKDDILNELAEDLRSQMEDREAELGRPLTEAEQEAFLLRHGNPIEVAGRYLTDRRSFTFGRQLIGPVLFPLYVKILGLNLFIAVAIHAGFLIAGKVSTLLPFFLQVSLQFGIVTLVFALLDFLQHKSPRAMSDFPPAHLRAIPRWSSIVGAVFWTALSLWWMAIPAFPFLILGPAAAHLSLTPAWEMLYVPVLLLFLAGLAQRAVNVARPHWTWLFPATRLFVNVLGLAVLCFARSRFPFIAVGATSSPERYASLAHGANALFSGFFLGYWLYFYLSINAVIYAAACVPHVRRWLRSRRTGAPLHISTVP
jgi:hypothetical protein